MFRLLLLSSAVALLFSSCATCWSGGIPLRESELAAHQGTLGDYGSTANVKVYKGLAHPVAEKRRYDNQVKKGGWVEIHDFKFFETPEPYPASTTKAVLDLYADPDSHQAWGPKSKCAGFHPDYVVVWGSGGDRKALQICYGCHEWKFFGPGGMLLTDISEPAYYDELTKLLPKDE